MQDLVLGFICGFGCGVYLMAGLLILKELRQPDKE